MGSDSKWFPIMGGPRIPWAMIEPHESQAEINHGQSLKRLAQRGGLNPYEAVHVLLDRKWGGVVVDDSEFWLGELRNIVGADLRAQLSTAIDERDAAREALALARLAIVPISRAVKWRSAAHGNALVDVRIGLLRELLRALGPQRREVG